MKKILLSLLTAISFGTTGCSAQSDSIDTLAPQAFIKQAKADTTAIILDVRTPGIKQLDKSHTYYVYCRSGKRSHNACIKMKKQGLKVFDMEGGILNWKKLGMPTTKE